MLFSTRLSRFIQMTCFSAAVVAIQGLAFAGEITTPTGLHGGDQFRIIFVTPGTIQASSPSISTYNTFVNTQAAGATYNGATIHWSAIVSTSVDAKDNVGQTASAVYMANGDKVADSADSNSSSGNLGLFAAVGLRNQPIQDLSGNTYSGSIWTGSSGLGTQYSSTPTPDGESTPITAYWGLGNSTSFMYGGTDYTNYAGVGELSSSGTGYQWLSTGNVVLNSNSFQIYGISDVLTVVPEPSTFVISGLGILMIGLVQRNRKRD